MALRSTLLGPRTVTLADQILSGISNVLAVVLVARALDKDDFGRFALGYAILSLTLSTSRTYFGTRVSLAPDRETARHNTAALTGALLLLAPFIALLVMGLAVVTAGTASLGLLAIVALATPVVLVQDMVRVGSASSGQPWAALLSDAIWVLLMAVPFVFQISLGSNEAMGLWAASALVALIVAFAAYGLRPHLSDGVVALRTRDAMGESLTLGGIVVNICTLILLAVVARVLGPAAAGALRGAASTMGPVNVLIGFAGLGLTPALVRRPRSQDLRFCVSTGVVMATLTALWCAVLLLMPHSVGVSLFKDSWDGIRHVLPFTTGEYLLNCTYTAALLGLKVRNEPRALRRLRLASATVSLVGGTIAAFAFDDVRGVAVAIILGALTAVVIGWTALLRSRAVPVGAPRPGSHDPAVNVLPV
jgi:O-antigen/teichoic acid export membrane protein